ncbi:hypothetical protein [Methylobacter sp. S3L5C]|uniref:hypothetical protein n=1 Tax=Methylobacter sp. S3L5C TaxID=2839024 RepID=UPI001FAE1B96|nr:hypothetical protein [Methylobacter sp. S3L5C]UOA06943.1 hypothetical protein KKZ03_11395 [Methylobacter sp. S3L5C]
MTIDAKIDHISNRLKRSLSNADFKESDFITIRVSITDKDGVLVCAGKISEIDEPQRAQP